MLKHIVVAVDFSDESRRALDSAVAVAQAHSARLTVLHVDPAPPTASGYAEPRTVPPDGQSTWEQKVARELDEFVRPVAGGQQIQIDPLLVSGVPKNAIGTIAERNGCDLLVIGARGASGLSRFLLGSVTEQVARSAPCPVLCTRGSSAVSGQFQRVIAAVDYSPLSAGVVKVSAALAAPSGLIDVLHVWQPPGGWPEQDTNALSEQVTLLNKFTAHLEIHVATEPHLVTGHAAEQILGQAEQANADLIVVGDHAPGRLERVLGTTADRVLRHADRSVVLVPQAALNVWGAPDFDSDDARVGDSTDE